ncbi:uncharacterized protein LOC114341672 isoform X2 [Diabrotica virgifera virgifera]|uniref:Uncharacterized protein n=2 Tax=Diabrotica virgifera virgifera TaxID=50390 RepID=A0ABM5KUE4_DIAVI|nr:uncharacterized protein LOC114341672 isoform X2 [Diabrotica virgifera virgifera]
MTSMRVILCTLFFILGVNSFKVDYNEPNGIMDVNSNYVLNEDYYETLKENSNNYENEYYELNVNEVLDTREKKSPAVCTVKKVLRTHPQDGYEYHPKHYHEYECVPVPKGIIDVDFSDQDKCSVAPSCLPVHKYVLILKKKVGTKCWKMERIKVNAGCKCISSVHML